VIGVAVTLVAAATITWSLFFALEAEPEATVIAAAMGMECPDRCAFAFGSEQARVGLIIYPGAGVEPAAYAPLAAEIADAGFLVTIQQAPLGLAILDSDMALASIDGFPGIDAWAVSGHSLGGAMAARFASESDDVDGLVFLGAYPEDGLDLSGSGLAVMSIYGDRDLLSTPDEVLSARSRLPDDTEFVLIEGGNHAQFGRYGRQPRDGEASIKAEAQLELVATAVIRLLDGLAGSHGG
jgi:pimeloyl-ACP methyl ester carboxylesterase